MRVIFIGDVPGVAKRNDIREVADGYALNYLLPNGLAVRATNEKIQALANDRSAQLKTQTKEFDRAQGLQGQLQNKTVMIKRPASSTGTLYASITPEMVVAAVKAQYNVFLLPGQVAVPVHIKDIGLHPAQINLHPQVKININLNIQPE